MMENNKWQIIREFIQATLKIVQPELDNDSIEAVKHYLNHTEYEMAFEGLFIEIMNLSEKPKIDYQKAVKIGKSLGLDKESIFEFEFWKKLLHFIGN